MSLIDRVRYLAGGCTLPQARAVIAEIYRTIGEGALVAADPHMMARALLDQARAMVQANAADELDDVEPHAGPLPSPVTGELEETTP